jgi:hypothetical protein
MMNRQQSRPITSRKRKLSPDDALETMGLSAISRAMDIPVDSALAILSSTLTGLAGQDAWIQCPWGITRLTKLDVLTAREDFRIQKWIDCLSNALEMMQRRLASNMGRYSPDAIELLTCGPHSSANIAKLADPEMRDVSLRRHSDMLTKPPGPGASGRLLEDLSEDSDVQRVEAVIHPRFLLKGVEGRNLKSLVVDCHLRSALVIQPKLELERKGSEPVKVMKILTDLLDGETVMKSPASIERGRDYSLPAKAQAILALTKGEIDALHAMASDHLNRFLWLKAGADQGKRPFNTNDGHGFTQTYQKTINEILGLRREGLRLLMSFENTQMVEKFESMLAAYELEIEETSDSAGCWARGLPQSLFWALVFFRRSMPPELRPDEESLVTVAFNVARRLVGNHKGQVLAITNAQLLADQCLLAGRIVEEVTKSAIKGESLKFVDLISHFNRQNKARFTPVIDVLLEEQVLVREPNKRLSLGPVDFADVEEVVYAKFVSRC